MERGGRDGLLVSSGHETLSLGGRALEVPGGLPGDRWGILEDALADT